MKPKAPQDKALRGMPLVAISLPRRVCYRALVVLLPFVLVGLAEVGLRVGGYGYCPSFFIRTVENGREVYIDNPKFGYRFFPPSIARAPVPFAFPVAKTAATFRVFVFGESAAQGDPEPSYGLARQVQAILQTAHPDKKVEVVNLAMTAINSYVIREIAREASGLKADAWIIYAGNNEVVGPFGAGTVFGSQAPPPALVWLNLRLKSTRLGQLLTSWMSSGNKASEWGGMEMFLDQQVGVGDPRLRTVYTQFARNLQTVLEYGNRAGAAVFVSTVAVNLDECPPFASKHHSGLIGSQKVDWETVFKKGVQAEAERHFAEAVALYDQSLRMDSEYAEAMFRRARCKATLGQEVGAMADFSRARDLDALRFRADSRINQTIARIACQSKVTLLDTTEALRGFPGSDARVFLDHVHFSFTGNYQVAAQFAERIGTKLLSKGASAVGQSETIRRLAWTSFDQRRVLEEMRARLRQPPFSSQLNAREREEKLTAALLEPATDVTNCISLYRLALALAPEDWILHANLARLLDSIGDTTGVKAEWTAVRNLLPHAPEAWFQLGTIAHGAGAYAEAGELFRHALKRNPDCLEAMNGLGLVAADEGHTAQAGELFRAAMQQNPRFSAARINLAVLLARNGDVSGATNQYSEVLRVDPRNVGARINLGKLLADQGQTKAALQQYEEAVQLAPENAVAQFNAGNALCELSRPSEALPHYLESVRLRPAFVEAHYALAKTLAEVGRLPEALPHFAETVQQKPEWAEARFNYGIALAKTQRYAEAAEAFEMTLKLEPQHAAAKAALERARRLLSQRVHP